MRLLLTRAAADAGRSRAALEARGHEVVVSPLIEIVGTGAAWPSGAVDALVATSAQAFAFAPDLPANLRTTLPLFLVGQRTLDAARARGFSGAATQAPVAVDLVALLGADGGPPMRLVYWAGRDRKPDLEAAVAARGDACVVIEAYVARETPGFSDDAVSGLAAGTIDAVLHFSRRSAILFLAACREAEVDAMSARHLCLSGDVAVPLRAAGCKDVEIAKAPSEAALLSLLGSVGHGA